MIRAGRPRRGRGFTLLESVIVIVITGIVFAIVAVFIRKPIDGYFDATRRAQLSDTADVALRRLVRDLRLALPNSVRVDPTGRVIEFLLTSGGGRYRADLTQAGGGNVLDFNAVDASFDVIGTMPVLLAGDQIVVFNLGEGFAGADAWQTGGNRTGFGSVSGSAITLNPARQFPFASPGKRFHVVRHAVSYECNLAQGVVRRWWNYGYNAAQVAPPSGGSNALLATQVSACSFAYDPSAAALAYRYGTVGVTLALTAGGETVRLFTQAHVANTP
ncbi:MAG: prepilin-type N-terminal cleavage/methylation domain-containing protein [Burkholderiales bacterium]|nr:prepilin-type N-terminal cleavage/methylation domain-containing protein [Burkholderiales bacterium]